MQNVADELADTLKAKRYMQILIFDRKCCRPFQIFLVICDFLTVVLTWHIQLWVPCRVDMLIKQSISRLWLQLISSFQLCFSRKAELETWDQLKS